MSGRPLAGIAPDRALLVAVFAVATLALAALILVPSRAQARGRSTSGCDGLAAKLRTDAVGKALAAARRALPPGSEVGLDGTSWRGCERLPRRYASVRVEPRVRGRHIDRATVVVMLLDAGGRRIGQARLDAALSVRIPVLVAARDLAADTRLKAGDVQVALLPPAEAGGRPLASRAQIRGQRLRRPLAAGAPLQEGSLARAVLVKRGALVTARLERGSLVLTSRALAKQDGRIGDTIQLASVDGSKSFVGRVAGSDLVTVN